MALSPEAERWIDAAWPIGGVDETTTELGTRLRDKGWHRASSDWNPLTLVSPGGTRYIITQTNAGPRAQRTT